MFYQQRQDDIYTASAWEDGSLFATLDNTKIMNDYYTGVEAYEFSEPLNSISIYGGELTEAYQYPTFATTDFYINNSVEPQNVIALQNRGQQDFEEPILSSDSLKSTYSSETRNNTQYLHVGKHLDSEKRRRAAMNCLYDQLESKVKYLIEGKISKGKILHASADLIYKYKQILTMSGHHLESLN